MDYKDAINKLEKSGVLVKDGEAVDVYATLEKGSKLAGDNHNISLDVRILSELGGPVPSGMLEMVATQIHQTMEVAVLKAGQENPELMSDLEREVVSGVPLTKSAFSVPKEKHLASGLIDFSQGDAQPVFTVDLGIINTLGMDESILRSIGDEVKRSMESNAPIFSIDETRLHVSGADKDFRHALEAVYDSAREVPPKNDISNRRKMH